MAVLCFVSAFFVLTMWAFVLFSVLARRRAVAESMSDGLVDSRSTARYVRNAVIWTAIALMVVVIHLTVLPV